MLLLLLLQQMHPACCRTCCRACRHATRQHCALARHCPLCPASSAPMPTHPHPQISGALRGTPAEGRVSNADLIALAGAYAVAICGGPAIDVPVGRTDATGPDPPGRMVSEQAGVAALRANFADKGLSANDLVVLSGAHTLGARAVLAMPLRRCAAERAVPSSASVLMCMCTCLSRKLRHVRRIAAAHHSSSQQPLQSLLTLRLSLRPLAARTTRTPPPPRRQGLW